MLPARTSISDAYPNPTNTVARAGFAALWDFINEMTQAAEIDVASAATIDVGGKTTNKLNITGTTAISSFGTNYRGPIFLRFAGQVKLTYNATTLITLTGADIWTQAGDTCMLYPKSSVSGTANGWIVSNYERGSPIVSVYNNIPSSPPGNVGALSNLLSYTIPANFFVNANRAVRVRAWGHTGAGAAVFTLAWNGLSIPMSVGAATTFYWELEGLVVKSGTNSQNYFTRCTTNDHNGAANIFTTAGMPVNIAATETAAIVLQFTGAGPGSNVMFQDGLIVDYLNW